MEWLKEILGEELFGGVIEKLGGKVLLLDDGNLIPKHRLDEVIAQRDSFKVQADETAAKMKELEHAAQGTSELQRQLDELQKGKADAEARLFASGVEGAVRLAAMKKGAKDPEDVLKFADVHSIIDGNKAADDVVGEIFQRKPYLFGVDSTSGGANPAGAGGADTIARQFGKGLRGEMGG